MHVDGLARDEQNVKQKTPRKLGDICMTFYESPFFLEFGLYLNILFTYTSSVHACHFEMTVVVDLLGQLGQGRSCYTVIGTFVLFQCNVSPRYDFYIVS